MQVNGVSSTSYNRQNNPSFGNAAAAKAITKTLKNESNLVNHTFKKAIADVGKCKYYSGLVISSNNNLKLYIVPTKALNKKMPNAEIYSGELVPLKRNSNGFTVALKKLTSLDLYKSHKPIYSEKSISFSTDKAAEDVYNKLFAPTGSDKWKCGQLLAGAQLIKHLNSNIEKLISKNRVNKG